MSVRPVTFGLHASSRPVLHARKANVFMRAVPSEPMLALYAALVYKSKIKELDRRKEKMNLDRK